MKMFVAIKVRNWKSSLEHMSVFQFLYIDDAKFQFLIWGPNTNGCCVYAKRFITYSDYFRSQYVKRVFPLNSFGPIPSDMTSSQRSFSLFFSFHAKIKHDKFGKKYCEERKILVSGTVTVFPLHKKQYIDLEVEKRANNLRRLNGKIYSWVKVQNEK